MASVHVREKNLEEARTLYRKIVTLRDESPEILFNAGLLEQKAGENEDALGHYSRAVELKPDFAEAHLNMGAALRSLGREDEAVEKFEKALELKPQLAKGYFSLKPMKIARPSAQRKVPSIARD